MSCTTTGSRMYPKLTLYWRPPLCHIHICICISMFMDQIVCRVTLEPGFRCRQVCPIRCVNMYLCHSSTSTRYVIPSAIKGVSTPSGILFKATRPARRRRAHRMNMLPGTVLYSTSTRDDTSAYHLLQYTCNMHLIGTTVWCVVSCYEL